MGDDASLTGVVLQLQCCIVGYEAPSAGHIGCSRLACLACLPASPPAPA